jgi:hypothetical protein
MRKKQSTRILFIVAGVVSILLVSSLIIRKHSRAHHNVRIYTFGEVCIVNLMKIDAMKMQWALEHHAKSGTPVTANDIAPYFKDGKIPQCLSGGTYTIGKVDEPPTCSVGTNDILAHVLP